jgi:hypothetical protein
LKRQPPSRSCMLRINCKDARYLQTQKEISISTSPFFYIVRFFSCLCVDVGFHLDEQLHKRFFLALTCDMENCLTISVPYIQISLGHCKAFHSFKARISACVQQGVKKCRLSISAKLQVKRNTKHGKTSSAANGLSLVLNIQISLKIRQQLHSRHATLTRSHHDRRTACPAKTRHQQYQRRNIRRCTCYGPLLGIQISFHVHQQPHSCSVAALSSKQDTCKATPTMQAA